MAKPTAKLRSPECMNRISLLASVRRAVVISESGLGENNNSKRERERRTSKKVSSPRFSHTVSPLLSSLLPHEETTQQAEKR